MRSTIVVEEIPDGLLTANNPVNGKCECKRECCFKIENPRFDIFEVILMTLDTSILKNKEQQTGETSFITIMRSHFFTFTLFFLQLLKGWFCDQVSALSLSIYRQLSMALNPLETLVAC